jgi:hypothetical protein
LLVVVVNHLEVDGTRETMASLTELKRVLDYWEDIHNKALSAQECLESVELAADQRILALRSIYDAFSSRPGKKLSS